MAIFNSYVSLPEGMFEKMVTVDLKHVYSGHRFFRDLTLHVRSHLCGLTHHLASWICLKIRYPIRSIG